MFTVCFATCKLLFVIQTIWMCWKIISNYQLLTQNWEVNFSLLRLNISDIQITIIYRILNVICLVPIEGELKSFQITAWSSLKRNDFGRPLTLSLVIGILSAIKSEKIYFHVSAYLFGNRWYPYERNLFRRNYR